MKLNKVYRNGNRSVNEDAYVVNKKAGIFAVIDGATGLEGVPGHIASGAVQSVLDAAIEGESFENRVKTANHLVGKETVKYLGLDGSATIDDVPKEKKGTCALAAISIDMDHLFLDYFQAADCMIFLQYENGDIRQVTYDLLHHFDQKAINEMVELRHKKDEQTSMAEAREEVRPTLMKNRSLLNTYDGYGVIDGSDATLNHLESGRLSLKKVTGILLLSDGLMLPTELEESDAWEQSAAIAFHSGLDGLLHEVENRENSDPECVTYPRLKMKDDKTGMLLDLGTLV
ncbi:Protein phosphatase 2C [Lentibacillus halodurans]|uniref:Protein phosphatase 2C n=1 Tax=Lentibacillus halodurans TaxID=237679 RepID=A0A1I0XLR0_9BACI|nr:PP2C family serine/threonine-protein phosphatase [Lentibacillus halodurans]SFB01912.1 Protein phosphatase 2C [Lentibacillus halodurans]